MHHTHVTSRPQSTGHHDTITDTVTGAATLTSHLNIKCRVRPYMQALLRCWLPVFLSNSLPSRCCQRYRVRVRSSRRHGQLQRSRYNWTGLMCVHFAICLRILGFNQPDRLFTVAVVKLWHTVDGLYMWVCSAIGSLWAQRGLPPHSAGSLSLPSITNGVSSEGVAPTGGRYGSVSSFFGLP
jgi:hypothetical protein